MLENQLSDRRKNLIGSDWYTCAKNRRGTKNMGWNDSPRIMSVQETVSILNQVIEKLDENDAASAQVMVGVAIHLLESLSLDLNQHLNTQRSLRELFSKS
jgi:hypothetical protein